MVQPLPGINTVSMMCTTPLVAPTSAVVTLALPLMYTPRQLFCTNIFWPSSVLTCCEALRSLLYTAAPATTWYSSTASNCLMFFGSIRMFNVALGSLVKASLVGANTVNGPSPSRAVTRLRAVRAATRVDRSLVLAASSTMLLLAAFAIVGGTNTVSMMCTTPLVAPTSAVVTLALPLMCTPFQPFVTSNCWPSSVLTCCEALRSLLYTAAPATTWYSSTASNCLMFFGSNRLCNVALGSLAKASLVGANTVNGPLPSRAVTRLPAVRAATRVYRSLVLAASSTMLLLAAFAIVGGTNTVSMMCTTPLVAPTSAVVTLALPLMCTPFQPFVTNNCWPSSVLTCCEAL